MNVVFLLTSVPEVRCGVGDYTAKLAKAFSLHSSVQVTIKKLPRWSFQHLLKLRRDNADKNTVFHLQYPSTGMGYSPLPGLLPFLFCRQAVFTTLHEFSVFNFARKISFLPHALLAKGILFSNEYECRMFQKTFPFARAPLHIVPIGNNIEGGDETAPRNQRRLIYFGQIGPDKGIEFFLDTVKILRQRSVVCDVSMIGSITNENHSIVKTLRAETASGNITLHLNLPPEDVSSELYQSRIALLPFPDGISEKRGSALACLEHGIAVLTTHSEKSPQWLKDCTHSVATAEQTALLVEQIINSPIGSMSAALKEELERRTWPNIAGEHMRLYQSA